MGQFLVFFCSIHGWRMHCLPESTSLALSVISREAPSVGRQTMCLLQSQHRPFLVHSHPFIASRKSISFRLVDIHLENLVSLRAAMSMPQRSSSIATIGVRLSGLVLFFFLSKSVHSMQRCPSTANVFPFVFSTAV